MIDKATATTALGWLMARGRRCLAFLGPATMVSVGYIDPGNWATDLDGGARFGYALLWVLVLSSTMAVLLQSLSARLGIVTGKNLAQGCRAAYSRRVSQLLWVLAELGIIACDVAEVMGSAIALNMLFGLPLLLGALLTTLDVLVILALKSPRRSSLELIVGGLLAVIAACLLGELLLAPPSASGLVRGLVPALPRGSLYVAIGILGATLMPHNLYLQSELVRTEPLPAAQCRTALRRSWLSTVLTLNLALLLNVAILLLSAEAFSARGIPVTDLRDAHRLLAPILGTSAASVLFAVGLLFSGQSATITGTLAGQIVMEGLVEIKISPAARRLITRSIAVVPAVLVLALVGEASAMQLLIASQVVLSLQLPFAIVPLLRLTNSHRLMGALANRPLVRYAAGTCAALVCTANGALLWKTFLDLQGVSFWTSRAFAATCLSGALFLAWVTFTPLRSAARVRFSAQGVDIEQATV